MARLRVVLPYVLVVLLAASFVWSSQRNAAGDRAARRQAAHELCVQTQTEHDVIRDILDHVVATDSPLPAGTSPELQALILRGREAAQHFHDFAVTRLGPRPTCD